MKRPSTWLFMAGVALVGLYLAACQALDPETQGTLAEEGARSAETVGGIITQTGVATANPALLIGGSVLTGIAAWLRVKRNM